MKESSGKLPLEMYRELSRFHAEGMFDECRLVKTPANFTGQYCTAFFGPRKLNESEIAYRPTSSPALNAPEERSTNLVTLLQLIALVMGDDRVEPIEPKYAEAGPGTSIFPSISFCIPSSCSADDLGKALAQLVGTQIIGNRSIVTFTSENYCSKLSDDPPYFDGADIAVM